jgi:hypothetical protein
VYRRGCQIFNRLYRLQLGSFARVVRGLCRFTCPAARAGRGHGAMGMAHGRPPHGAWAARHGAMVHGLESEVRAVVIRDRDGRIPGTGYRDFLVACVHRGEQEHRRSSTTPREATGPTSRECGPGPVRRWSGHDILYEERRWTL